MIIIGGQNMSLRVSIVEAKSGFSRLVKHAQEEPVIITRRGRAEAVILPFDKYERLQRLAAYSSMVLLSRELEGVDVTATELHQASRCEVE
jgi:prevent-host-death family protein